MSGLVGCPGPPLMINACDSSGSRSTGPPWNKKTWSPSHVQRELLRVQIFWQPSLGAMWNGDSLLKKMNAKRSVCSKSGANNWRLFPILNFSIRSRESCFAKLFTYFKFTYIRRIIRPGTNKMRVSLISIFNYFTMWLVRVNSYNVNHTKMYSC